MVIIFGLLVLLRVVLSNRLPAFLMPEMPHDDGWMFSQAQHLLKGDWLGPYNQLTLINGIFSPLLLAFSACLGVSFNGLNTAIYCFACVVFIASLYPLIKNQLVQIICFVILLFNPITYALNTGQRVYRIGMGQWEILLIFGCLIALFLRRGSSWKRLATWAALGGISLAAFLHTREEGPWIYPFVIGAIGLTISITVLEKRHSKARILIFLLPVLFALFSSGIVAAINYNHYGMMIVNDRSGGNYAKVAGDLYLIKPDLKAEQVFGAEQYKNLYYTIYSSTMEASFAASPTLNSAADPIRAAIRAWGQLEEIKNGQLLTDHMIFALRDGVESAGHYRSLRDAEAFYGKVHQELQTAFENGTLGKRGLMLSPLVKPIQLQDLIQAFYLMRKAVRGISNFEGVSAEAEPSIGSEINVKEFGLMAGGDFFTSRGWLSGAGWAFASDDKIQLSAGLYDNQGDLIRNLPFQAGEDVLWFYKGPERYRANRRSP